MLLTFIEHGVPVREDCTIIGQHMNLSDTMVFQS